MLNAHTMCSFRSENTVRNALIKRGYHDKCPLSPYPWFGSPKIKRIIISLQWAMIFVFLPIICIICSSLCFAMCNHQKYIYLPNLQRDLVLKVWSVSITGLPSSICFKLPTEWPSQCVLMDAINLGARGNRETIKMTNALGIWRIACYQFKHLHLQAQTLCSMPHFHIIANFNSADCVKGHDGCWIQKLF